VWDDVQKMEHVSQQYAEFEHDHYAITAGGLKTILKNIPDDFIVNLSQEECGDFSLSITGPQVRTPFTEEEVTNELAKQELIAKHRAERDKVLEEVRERSRKNNPCGILGLQWQDHLKTD
jgi:hypothetical protein